MSGVEVRGAGPSNSAFEAALVAFSFAVCLLVAPAAAAELCGSITVERPQERPLGVCLSDPATSCGAHSDCTRHSKDYCVKGVSAAAPAAACAGGVDCIESIVFHFDREYSCGRFANGDWWVQAEAGELTLTRITPDHSAGCEPGVGGACLHGWETNPEHERQSLSSRGGRFQANTPTLPHRVSGVVQRPVSVVKAIDNAVDLASCPSTCFLFAAVLTIVPSPPPTDSFRPPFAGPRKPIRYYTLADLDLNRIPALDTSSVSGSVPLAEISRFFSAPFLGQDARNNQVDDNMTVYQSYLDSSSSAGAVSGYHAARTGRTAAALLRLLLDDADYAGDAGHRLALYRAVQLGLDMSYIAKNWHDGTRIRIKSIAVPIAFSAYLLGDPELASTGFPGFAEMDTIYASPRRSGQALWGYACTEDEYWDEYVGPGVRWCGDPYGYVDSGGAYQACCSSGPWKGGALLLRLLGVPGDIGDMQLEPFMRYEERWVETGYATAPDPCAPPPASAAGCTPPNCPGYGVTWGPVPGNGTSCHERRSCECIPHTGDVVLDGRKSSLEATSADGGAWHNGYADRFWAAFGLCASGCDCPGQVCASLDEVPLPQPLPALGPTAAGALGALLVLSAVAKLARRLGLGGSGRPRA